MGCIQGDLIVDLVEGRVAAEQRAEILAHTETCPACRRLLADAALALSPEVPGEDEPDLPLQRGTKVGRYVVVDVAGVGAVGVVYSAYDPELDRKVALKLLRSTATMAADRGELELRLRREAQAMARLSHPNVVGVHDVAAFRDGLFVAMEYIEGETLGAWLRGGRRGWREVLEVFSAAARGLAAAHHAGVLHRDFKPDNVLIDGRGRVAVTDFGLARAIGDVAEPAPASASTPLAIDLTATREVVGTPAYMAPEVLRGGLPTTASDQWSFCVSLFEGLHGARPFRGESYGALLAAVTGGHAAEPPRGRDVPAWLRRVAARGLSGREDARYPSMDALAAALRRAPRTRFALGLGAAALLVTGLSVQMARSASVAPAPCRGAAEALAPAWGAERRARLAVVFAGARAAPAWVAVERSLDRFAEQWVQVHTEACEATRVAGHQSEEVLDRRMACLAEQREIVRGIGDVWAEGDAALVARATETMASLPAPRSCGGNALMRAQSIAPAPAASASTVAALRAHLVAARARFLAGDSRRGVADLRALAAAARATGYLPIDAAAQTALALALTRTGDLDGARAAAEEGFRGGAASGDERLAAEALTILTWTVGVRQAHPEEGQRLAAAAAVLAARVADEKIAGDIAYYQGIFSFERGDIEGAHQRFLILLEQRLRLLGPDDRRVADALMALSRSSREALRFAAGRAFLERAVGVYEKAYGSATALQIAPAVNNLGQMLFDDGADYEGAEVHLRRAMAIYAAAGGDEGSDVAFTSTNLAVVEAARGRFDEALATARHAVSVLDRERGPEHPEAFWAHTVLGMVHLERGEPRPAAGELAPAAERTRAHHGPDHVETGQALMFLGAARALAGEPEGLAVLDDALRIARGLGPRGRLLLARSLTWRCRGLVGLGRAAEAGADCAAAVLNTHELLGPAHPLALEADVARASCELTAGRATGGRAHLEAALAALVARGGEPVELTARARALLAR